jgi:hypothetical protein
MKIRTFWDVAPCSFFGVDRRFRGAYCLHNQDDLMIQYAFLRSRSTPSLHGATSQQAQSFFLSSCILTCVHVLAPF